MSIVITAIIFLWIGLLIGYLIFRRDRQAVGALKIRYDGEEPYLFLALDVSVEDLAVRQDVMLRVDLNDYSQD
ncbi:MAG: hypothetical protein LUG25_03560 [Oscillospiraceae bacterium]|nr:hypothetical protein [Oscillospiraceae bacterium]